MVNVVTAGRFKGKRIKADSEGAFIPFGREHLDITSEIVDHIKMMSMRDKGDSSKSLVTLEVKHNAIVQAYRAFNKLPNEQEQKFIEEFAKEKKLCFELEYYEEDDDWTEEEDDAV